MQLLRAELEKMKVSVGQKRDEKVENLEAELGQKQLDIQQFKSRYKGRIIITNRREQLVTVIRYVWNEIL